MDISQTSTSIVIRNRLQSRAWLKEYLHRLDTNPKEVILAALNERCNHILVHGLFEEYPIPAFQAVFELENKALLEHLLEMHQPINNKMFVSIVEASNGKFQEIINKFDPHRSMLSSVINWFWL